MIVKPPKNLRLWWSEEKGWIVDVPFGISDPMLKSICDYALKTQIQRYTYTPEGEKRQLILKGIEALKQYKITQRITGLNNDFKSDIIPAGAL